MAWSARRAFWRLLPPTHAQLYRLSRGRIGGGFRGAPILLLNHVGRRSGRWRTTPLLYLPDGDEIVVIASRGGSRGNPDWFLNLREMEETTVELGGATRPVSVRLASAEERRRLWPRVVEMHGAYADYQGRTEREIPVVILSPIGDQAPAGSASLSWPR